MSNLFNLFLISLCVLVPDSWEETIDPRDGMSYIRVAEDITASGIRSIETRDLVTELYVFAAIADHHLRNSAILGLISIASDVDLQQRLHSVEQFAGGLLVPSIVGNKSVDIYAQPESVDTLCATLTSLRKGRTLSAESRNQLRPWGYLFEGGFDKFMQRANQRRRLLSQETIESTLRVELAILGGPLLWSADYAATSGKPVALSVNNDLATMFGIDPTKRVRKNGEWVVE